MNIDKIIYGVFIIAAITFLTRLIPFLFFRIRKPPQIINFFSDYMPPVVMAVLVVYCMKDIKWADSPYGIPEITAVILTAVLHLRFRNPLISILGGTALYMFLIQSEIFSKIL